MKLFHSEGWVSSGYYSETTNRTGLLVFGFALLVIAVVASTVYINTKLDIGVVKTGIAGFFEALLNIGEAIFITFIALLGVGFVFSIAIYISDGVKELKARAQARAGARDRAIAEARARARARVEAERRRREAERLEARRRIEAYQRVVSLLANSQWEEAIPILESLPSGYREVTSLLVLAKKGAHLDGLCAQAEEFARKGKWLEAKATIDRVPVDWRGRHDAAVLKQRIEVEAAAAALGNTPWEVLGVAHGASQETIRQAYRRLARQYHPDVRPDDLVAAACMRRINWAYGLLDDPEKLAAWQKEEDRKAKAEAVKERIRRYRRRKEL